MRRLGPNIALLAAAGLVPFALLFCAGCGDASSSRASTSSGAPAESETNDKAGGPAPSTVKVSVEEDPQQSTPQETGDASSNVVTRKPVEAAKPAQDKANTSRVAASPTRKGTREISFDTIKFDMEKGAPFERAMLTDAIEKLNGTRVRIRGYMLPSFQQSGIKQFVLVRDNQECCFGPGAALFDCIIVDMGEKTTEYSVRPVAVEGTFSIREFKGPDDTHLAIYHLEGDRVR